MRLTAKQDAIASRFRLDRPPTVLAHVSSHALVSFCRLRTEKFGHGLIENIGYEEAYVFHVSLASQNTVEVWTNGKRHAYFDAPPGATILVDLTTNPVVRLDRPFDTLRFYISKALLDELAFEKGFRRADTLRAPAFGQYDPVMYGLAQTVAAAMENADEPAMFADYIALAFHTHVCKTYGGRDFGRQCLRGGLAPRQLRRVTEAVDANLSGDPSVSTLAKECGLSTSHFARAFRQSTGMAPHQWLIRRRIEFAKALLLGDRSLAEIAIACGFADQSHLTRHFARSEGSSPARWRRLNRR
ncbi:MAG TPA: AraC family transcriptional regulator [Bryobacteraceae bacterium]|jgi:AraC-like DNA-binding protein